MYQYHMSEMYHITPQDFREFVCLSHSWSDLARRCGHTGVHKVNMHSLEVKGGVPEAGHAALHEHGVDEDCARQACVDRGEGV